MHAHPTPRRRLARLLIAGGIAVATVGIAADSATAQQPGDLTICHRTNSNKNPYITVTTDQNGQNGGTDHLGEHTGPLWNPDLKKQKIEWGDVIPPTAENPDGSEAYQELVAGGGDFEDFVAAGCAVTPVPTHGVTLDKVTTGGTAPAATTDFTFEVTCESGTVTATPTVSPEDSPITVASDVAEDDLCTITETGLAGATGVTFQVTGGTVQSTTTNSVTFGVGADVSVVATNAYPEPVPPVVPPAVTPPAVSPNVVTPAPAQVAAETLARTGSPADHWYVVAGLALAIGGVLLYGSTARRLLGLRSR